MALERRPTAELQGGGWRERTGYGEALEHNYKESLQAQECGNRDDRERIIFEEVALPTGVVACQSCGGVKRQQAQARFVAFMSCSFSRATARTLFRMSFSIS